MPPIRVLLVVVSHSFSDPKWHANIKLLPNSVIAPCEDVIVDMIAVSSKEEELPECGGVWACGPRSFGCAKFQLSKMCLAMANWRERNPDARYDWYVKTRPELEMHSPLDLKALIPGAINARARCYTGPLKMAKAASVGGRDAWACHRHYSLICAETEAMIVLDDQIYAFDAAVADSGAFLEPQAGEVNRKAIAGAPPNAPQPGGEDEWIHSQLWKNRGAKLRVASVDCTLMKHRVSSGDLLGWVAPK